MPILIFATQSFFFSSRKLLRAMASQFFNAMHLYHPRYLLLGTQVNGEANTGASSEFYSNAHLYLLIIALVVGGMGLRIIHLRGKLDNSYHDCQ
jgi:hypothetical protein